jgi:hypothetical protein
MDITCPEHPIFLDYIIFIIYDEGTIYEAIQYVIFSNLLLHAPPSDKCLTQPVLNIYSDYEFPPM